MPYRVCASGELGLVVVRLEGVVTADEVTRHLSPLVEVPELSLLPMLLLDTTDALRSEGPSDIVRATARRAYEHIDPKLEGPGRMAIAAPSDEFFGFARMYQSSRQGSRVEVAVFRSRPEAEKWLGLPPGYEQDLKEVP
jgi:hypothetical protein